jgi:hypothetical protein
MGKLTCIEKQYLELQQKYPYLLLTEKGKEYILYGTVFIENGDIKDQYEIEIYIPSNYPKGIPIVKEVDAKIPEEFHHCSNRSLCLETPFRMYKFFYQSVTLRSYIDELVVPYLFSYSYYVIHGKLPFGEHRHGEEGILEDYKKEFGVIEDLHTIMLLQILVENNYRGHHLCPCGSDKRLRNCHGQIILSMKAIRYNFINDFGLILLWLEKVKKLDISPFLSEEVKKEIEKIKYLSAQNSGIHKNLCILSPTS